MFINCQECNTTFRLDERLLKLTGSKVRCSQCLHTFIAFPPGAKIRKPSQPPSPTESLQDEKRPARMSELEAHEVEGIDFSELDAMLEGGGASGKFFPPAPESAQAGKAGSADDSSLELDAESDLEPQAKESEDDAAQAQLDEIDLDMDFELEDAAEDATEEQEEELDLASLRLDEETEPAQNRSPLLTSEKKDDEEELGLALENLDLEPNKKDLSPAAYQAPSKKPDDLDLADLDLDLDAAAPRRQQSHREEPELSLADEAEAASSEPPAVPRGHSSPKEDTLLDLGEIDLEMEDKPPRPKEEALEEAMPSDKPTDELDLSGLDTILAPAGENKGAPQRSEPAGDDLPELQLELDTDSQEVAPKTSEGGLEELEFELESEFEDKKPGPDPLAAEGPPAPEGDDEIDLSDIEEMLGSDAAAAQARPDLERLEDLGAKGEGGEIDLAEIESAIDQADEMDKGRGNPEDAELDLDIDLDSGAAPAPGDTLVDDLQLDTMATKGPEPEELKLEMQGRDSKSSAAQRPSADLDDELDLSDLADLVEANEPESKRPPVETGDIELEFQVEGEDQQAPALTPAKNAGRSAPAAAEELEDFAEEERPAGKGRGTPKPKRSRAGLIVLVIVLLLAAGGYAVYYAATQMGVEIPYLSTYLNPKPADPTGALNLSTLDINSKFIENAQSGRLFVIIGKVRNGYSTPRNLIRMQGKLFSKGKVLVKNEFSYAGTVISDQDLSALSIAEIKQRLNQDGAGSVRPGQDLQFMLVFSDLPSADQLDEFAVEAVSSAAPAAK